MGPSFPGKPYWKHHVFTFHHQKDTNDVDLQSLGFSSDSNLVGKLHLIDSKIIWNIWKLPILGKSSNKIRINQL